MRLPRRFRVFTRAAAFGLGGDIEEFIRRYTFHGTKGENACWDFECLGRHGRGHGFTTLLMLNGRPGWNHHFFVSLASNRFVFGSLSFAPRHLGLAYTA